VKPINAKQMKLGLFKGSANIRNLELQETALPHHQIPFIVRKGIIGSLYLKFPWQNLADQPTIIEIHDVLILLEFDGSIILKAAPVNHTDGSANGTRLPDPPPLTPDKRKTIQGLLESVIDNLRITIENIHISIRIPHEPDPVHAGLTCPILQIFSVDENYQQIYDVRHPEFVRKQVMLIGVGTYFDVMGGDPIPTLSDSGSASGHPSGGLWAVAAHPHAEQGGGVPE
jgi:vacuolar protein sorting-associated protein 13A/C